MYNASLPSYGTLPSESSSHIPSYSAVPSPNERRLALNDRSRSRPRGEFVKQTKSGDITLRLSRQDGRAALPEYGCGMAVEGSVDILKTDGVTRVEVKVPA